MNDEELAQAAGFIAKTFKDDPEGYCKGVLGFTADRWQADVLSTINKYRRCAIRSGHGVGKTRLAASVVHWFMSTRSFPRIRCTANTEKQIMSVLWTELAKIHREAKNKELFEWTKTKFYLKAAPEVHWAEAIAWSEENSEAFAGIHEENVLYIMDEASAIPDIIWEVAQGAMTSDNARWLVLGNPTRNTGKFHECFGRNKWTDGETDTSKWHTWTISCFDSKRGNMPQYIAEIEREYGKDSDPYRVRVLGLPPMQETQQFISLELVETAIHKNVLGLEHEPKILGVDVARFGEDRSVLIERKGRHSKIIKVMHGQDTMAVTGAVMNAINEAKSGEPYDYVCVDVIGVGSGVVDRLVEQGIEVSAVNVAEKPRMENMKNLRAELWQRMKDWLSEGHVPEEMKDDLIGPQYSFDSSGRLVIERKEDMAKRGLASPDLADALALTFFVMNAVKIEHRIARKPKPLPRWASKAGIR